MIMLWVVAGLFVVAGVEIQGVVVDSVMGEHIKNQYERNHLRNTNFFNRCEIKMSYLW